MVSEKENGDVEAGTKANTDEIFEVEEVITCAQH